VTVRFNLNLLLILKISSSPYKKEKAAEAYSFRKGSNSMVCDNLCSTQRHKPAASQNDTDSSPPPPYSKKDKSDKSDSKGGDVSKC
jgi:hypothetical protein